MTKASRSRVQSVTTARAGRHEDVAKREKRYLVMMGIRIACLPPAVFIDGWVRWFFIAGVIILPYIAVVIANAVARPRDGTLTPADPGTRAALPADSGDVKDSAPSGPSGPKDSV